MDRRIRVTHAAALLIAAANLAVSPDLHAQRAQPIAFPEKPMRMIVPFPPGGGNDIVGRAVAQRLSEVVGQQVVVDNRPGAGGVVGVTIAAQAVPDGYTMLLGSVGMLAHNPALKRDLAYSPLRDFAPVALLVTSPMIIAVNPGLPVKTVAELIALAKASPGKLNYASGGTGSSLHMTGELFLRATGTNMLHVPYKGGGPALVDLVGGRVDLIFSTMPPALSLVKSGKLRAVAVTTTRRAPALPEVPTVGETVKGFEVTNWQGIVVPSKTPQAIVRKLHADLAATMKLPAMGETMAQQG
ncbi:MAG: tripartite tricarboxylate transporter substrate binding protein, partial [Rhodocyclaceae bacterium]|nr:tripartite tricarboxylate transporter substrate binding protein [Rhodocyclaceae bacterium]MCA3124918.1 tripartite tricarboxylate transporter substrate binding protein [Rhodocyclaceae bacterium]